MPTIYCDTRQHAGKHTAKEAWWREHGIELVPRALSFGDYMADGSNVSVDTKRDVQELAGDLGRDHDRFRREIQRANAAGYMLVVLVERSGRYRERVALARWVSTVCGRCKHRSYCAPAEIEGRRCAKGWKPLQGKTLAEQIGTFEKTYLVRFEFCDLNESPRRVCELLGVDYGEHTGAGEGRA